MPDLTKRFLARVESLEGPAEMRREFMKDLTEKNVLQELRSPVLNKGNLDGEKLPGLEVLSETFDGGLLAEEDIPGFRGAKEEAYHAQEMRFA